MLKTCWHHHSPALFNCNRHKLSHPAKASDVTVLHNSSSVTTLIQNWLMVALPWQLGWVDNNGARVKSLHCFQSPRSSLQVSISKLLSPWARIEHYRNIITIWKMAKIEGEQNKVYFYQTLSRGEVYFDSLMGIKVTWLSGEGEREEVLRLIGSASLIGSCTMHIK